MNEVVVTRNARLPGGVLASAIYVSPAGEVYIVTDESSPKYSVPSVSNEYLEAVCSKFYYGGVSHRDAIAGILLLHGALSKNDFGVFYEALRANLSAGRVTVISPERFQ